MTSVGEVDIALAARLDEEIATFSFDATTIRDAREFAATVHDYRGALLAGVKGGPSGRHRVGRAVVGARRSPQLALTTHSFQALDFYRRHAQTTRT